MLHPLIISGLCFIYMFCGLTLLAMLWRKSTPELQSKGVAKVVGPLARRISVYERVGDEFLHVEDLLEEVPPPAEEPQGP